MKDVLVLTDFSESAVLASEFGIRIAQNLNLGITFLHVITTPVEWKNLPLEKEKLYPETKFAIGDAKDQLFRLERKAENLGVETHTSLVFNIGIGEIHKFINPEKYDFVVIGIHGVKGKNKPPGSNTLKIIYKSRIPVMAVKLGEQAVIPKKWVIVSHFTENSRDDFNKLMARVKKLEISVQLLYVNTPYNFAETEKINNRLDNFMAPHKNLEMKSNIINARDEKRGIEYFLKTFQCDLVALIFDGLSGVTPLFETNVMSQFLYDLEVPVISIMSSSHRESCK